MKDQLRCLRSVMEVKFAAQQKKTLIVHEMNAFIPIKVSTTPQPAALSQWARFSKTDGFGMRSLKKMMAIINDNALAGQQIKTKKRILL